MKIVGCDFHPSCSRWRFSILRREKLRSGSCCIAMAQQSGFIGSWKLRRWLVSRHAGNSQWFIELAEGLGHVVWVGDAAQIRAGYVRRHVRRQDCSNH